MANENTPAMQTGRTPREDGERFNRRRRPRRRSNPTGQNGHPQQEKEATAMHQEADENRQEQRSNRNQKKQFRNFQESGENREPEKDMNKKRNNQELRRNNRNDTFRPQYEPDWGIPPEPNSQSKKKPVDQELSGRFFTRRG